MRKWKVVLLFCMAPCLVKGQNPKIIKLKDLETILHGDSYKIQVINFWATWCGPCVAELPLFEKLNMERAIDVKVTLVSLDMDLDPNPQKVYKFISRKKIQSEILILDEKDPNSWINKIDEEWTGAIPATIIINPKTGKRKFIGKELHEGELEKLIEEVR